MNKCILVGRLTKAPEAKQTNNGVAVTTFTIAVNRRMNREETDFLNIVTWRGLAENCAKYLEKGRQVCVEGEIHIRSYEAQDGQKKYVTEIVADNVEFLGQGQKQGYETPAAAQAPADSFFAGMTAVEQEAVLDDWPF